VPTKCATIESRAADNMFPERTEQSPMFLFPERTGQSPMFQALQRGMVGDWT